MKQVKHRYSTSKVLSLCLAVLLAFSTSVFAQGDPAAGKSLFNANCAACHKLDKPMTGPALRNVEQRLADEQGLDREWIYNWVRNSSKMIKDGDAYANKIFKEYDNSVMTLFPQLTNTDIDNILAYTAEVKPEPETPEGPITVTPVDSNNDLILGALVLVLLVLVAMLFMVSKTLKSIASKNGINVDEGAKKPIWKAFVENQFLVLVSVIVFMLFAAYHAYGYFMQVGVDQGYQPVQPIHFSHKIHAGDNKIDCKYCHSSARVSKTSGIPALNVCMNCHKNISEVAPSTATAEHTKEFYDKQIQKLYNAVGWDGQKYSGEQKPVKWVRVHNLPDFAYFNHSQHVTVAGVECQTCHGPVEEMEILEQFAPLTMGWCVNCHKETEVDVKGNEYYAKIHKELSEKYGVEKLTAAQMGGLECGKCHY
ncbi:cytochrome c3 family protein [Pseudofulvibacter geojedonensis]|uniref:Cytochrome c3 family protein n=1 Tax=Pseudofulvibacter geojedonensis TaxID=1123758 RepID=A0ABW3I1B7_9FLAO